MPVLPGLPDIGSGTSLNYGTLAKQYENFAHPEVYLELGGDQFADKGNQSVLNDLFIELSSGFEASVARFRIYGIFDRATGRFGYESVKKQVVLGNSVHIKLGYLGGLTTVFTGFVAAVNFGFDPATMAYIEVTALDAKGIMMQGVYAQQLAAKSYGAAVKEVLQKTAYEKLQNSQAITGIQVMDTPDKLESTGQPSAYTIEMNSESDYEFIVKAAKKFNYEFFVDAGTVVFRPAKMNTASLITLGVGEGLNRFDIGYSVNGMVETIEARAMNPGDGKVISAKSKYTGTLSTSSKAKGLVSKSRKIYIDPTISSQSQAEARAKSLMEKTSYRLGTLDAETVGIPELRPGRFIQIAGLGEPVDNSFYLTTVVHEFSQEYGYRNRLTGKADQIQKGMGL